MPAKITLQTIIVIIDLLIIISSSYGIDHCGLVMSNKNIL